MQLDPSIRTTDYKIIAVLVAMLAGLVAAIGLSMNDPSIDNSHVDPIRTSHLSSTVTATQTGAQTTVTAKTVTPEENWAADDSSHGMRPDAAH